MRNERDANTALAARTHNASAVALAARREAQRNQRKPCTINCLVPFFILASAVYAGVCLYL